ncbi:MAG: hypothetical protein M1161_00075 [Candidatus Thermoplasmatota archaeon]|jgi:hypothetical protein|nr:hypothetical protein [Candidatus Thermoplasmatota archaeon]
MEKSIGNTGLRCPITSEHHDFFISLMDYRNKFYTSDQPEEVAKFYEDFDSLEELEEWRRERPRGIPYLHEVEGDKEIIVVVPTSDYYGNYARLCREEVFSGLHIIFVESGSKGDFYFNLEHYCNTGFKKALEYNPKWIIYSNDDLVKLDDVNVLRRELSRIDHQTVSSVFATPNNLHSFNMIAGISIPFVTNIAFLVYECVFKREGRKLVRRVRSRYRNNLVITKFSLLRQLILRKKLYFLFTGDFVILSSRFVSANHGNVFDEAFINGQEDYDLSVRLSLNKKDYAFINYRVGGVSGASLGNGPARRMRDIINSLYIAEKLGVGELHGKL